MIGSTWSPSRRSRSSVLSPTTKRWCNCSRTTACFHNANASYHWTCPTSCPAEAYRWMISSREREAAHVEGDRRRSVDRVGWLFPVAHERAEVDERVADRGHVPVEDRRHTVGFAGCEHGVVELEVVVEDRHSSRRRPGRHEELVDLVEPGIGPVVDPVPAMVPSGELPFDETVRTSEPIEPDRFRLDRVEVGERVDQCHRDPVSGIGSVREPRGDLIAHDQSPATFDDEERSTDDRQVVAERQRAGCPVEHRPEPAQDPVLPCHVVSTGRDLSERWAAHDQLGRAHRHAVREVGVSTRELLHVQGSVEVGDLSSEPCLEVGPVLLVGHRRGVAGQRVEVRHHIAVITSG